MRTLRDLLTDFNKHMYDVTDGQVRIGAVVFGRMGRHPDHHYDGAFRIYKDFKTGDHGVIGENEKYLLPQFRPWAYLGTPDRPGDSHIAFESLGTYGKDNLARVIAHEFCHAAFGLPDEYEDQKDDKTGRIYSQSLCSKNEALRRAWNACIMSCSNPMYREWCKPDTHAKNTGNARLQADDCYTKAAMAIKKAFGRDLVIPETPVEGPTNPPDPRFSWE
jgi:M6 family metalloprotease-like protein